MNKAKILESLIKESGYNVKSFAEKCGIPYTTLYGILKNGVGRASMDNILLICRTLGITVEKLEELADGIPKEKTEPTYENAKLLIARNGKKLTPEQRMELIKLLSEIK